MQVTVRDLEVAQVLAREVKAAAARSAQASLRADQVALLFGAAQLDASERGRIQSALEMVGLDPQPSLLEVEPDAPVVFVAAAARSAVQPVSPQRQRRFGTAATGGGRRGGRPDPARAAVERGEFPTVGEFARSTFERARRRLSDSGADAPAVNGASAGDHEPAPAVAHDFDYEPPAAPDDAVSGENARPEPDDLAGEPSAAAVEDEVAADPGDSEVDQPRDLAPHEVALDEHETDAAESPGEEPPDAETPGEEPDRVAEDSPGEVGAVDSPAEEPDGVAEDLPGEEPDAETPAEEPDGVAEHSPGEDPETPGQERDGVAEDSPGEVAEADAADAPVEDPPEADSSVEGSPEAEVADPEAVSGPSDPAAPEADPEAARLPVRAEVAAAIAAAATLPVVGASLGGWRFGAPYLALVVVATGWLAAKARAEEGSTAGVVDAVRVSPAALGALRVSAALTIASVAAAFLLAAATTTSRTSDRTAPAALGDWTRPVAANAGRIRASARKRARRHRAIHRTVRPPAVAPPQAPPVTSAPAAPQSPSSGSPSSSGPSSSTGSPSSGGTQGLHEVTGSP